MRIGSLQIDQDSDPVVIAEIGSNWHKKQDLLTGINMAKACGADAVKFQAFTHEALYGYEDESSPLNKYQLPIPWVKDLKAKADAADIELLITPFSPGLMDEINPYVNAFKLAGSDFQNKRLIDRAIHHNKPMIMSMGGHNVQDAIKVRAYLESQNYLDKVIFLYGVSDYPARNINLRRIKVMSRNHLVGFTDHTVDINEIPRRAVEMGAKVIEKHFNPGSFADTPDAGHSLTNSDFKAYVNAVKGIDNPEAPQNEMRMKHNRRIIAIKDIIAGEALIEGLNFGIYRAKERDDAGISPLAIDAVVNKVAKVNIPKGKGINLSLIQ